MVKKYHIKIDQLLVFTLNDFPNSKISQLYKYSFQIFFGYFGLNGLKSFLFMIEMPHFSKKQY